MKEQSQWVELAGHDYVLDLIADLELPVDFPKQKSYFIISTDNPARVRANTSLSVCRIHSVASNPVKQTSGIWWIVPSLFPAPCWAAALTQTRSFHLPFLSAAAAADRPTACLTLMVTTVTVHKHTLSSSQNGDKKTFIEKT